ncbi:MAG: two-component system regulatory protein YycI [Candidatus Contubernalis sp.]|nr:two-component system regulatory protein YycI [Candidatus Contubernalis sp.]
MEWSKAKSILIMIFLALNLFLGYSLWEDFYMNFPSRVVSQREIEEARAQLEFVNLELQASISRQIFSMSFLTVSNLEQQGETLVASLFDSDQPFILEQGGEGTLQVYRQDKKQIYLWENGKVIFTQEPTGDGEEPMDEVLEESAAVSMAEEFLRNAHLFPVDARLEEVHPLGDRGYLIRYNQVYINHSLYGGYLLVQVTPQGVEQFELYWLEPQGFSGQEISNISAAKALARLADNLEPFSKRAIVEAVNIGYYSEAFDAQKWDMVPVWRIRLSNGRTYYINAYTGELEGMEEM